MSVRLNISLCLIGLLSSVGLCASQSAVPNAGTAGATPRLSIQEAEAIALKNNPAISEARLNALASEQVTEKCAPAFGRRPMRT